MKRILYLSLCLLLIFGAFCFAVSASTDSYEGEANSNTQSNTYVESETDSESIGTDAGSAENIDAEDDGANIFATVYAACIAHSEQILTALACVLSALLMLIFKKSIIPLIKNGLSALSGGVEALSAEAKKANDATQSIKTVIDGSLNSADSAITSLTELGSRIERRLAEAEDYGERAEKLRVSLECQITLLYEILMASSIPQFEKERVAELIANARAVGLTSEATSYAEN